MALDLTAQWGIFFDLTYFNVIWNYIQKLYLFVK